ncbi:MAG: 4Fe-4S double cluster binding domain-containing protein [Planctomycetota bacterium]|jgi:ferredoxin
MEPYRIVGRLERFDRSLTAFARHPSGRGATGGAERPAAGASSDRLGRALRAGARAPDRLLREQWEPETFEAASDRYDPPDRDEFTGQVKSAARFYGASLVGVTRVNPLWLYATDDGGLGCVEGAETAVVMAVEMDYDMIATSPSASASAATGKGYSHMAFVATCLGRYLSELGFRAVPSGNDIALSIPLAIDAGLGELGRNGSLITQAFGPRVRLCKVFTDAPLTPDEPFSFGARDTCRTCDRCVRACPGGAIAQGEMTDSGPTPSNNPGVLKWYADPDKCLAFWRINGMSCANCIRSCPFGKP